MLADEILFNVPCPVFWKDLNGVFLGCNKLFVQLSGFSDASEIIGKKDDELPWGNLKDEYHKDNMHIITTGKQLKRIQNIKLVTHNIISETTKTPLIHNGKIIGVIGICIDITHRIKKAQIERDRQANLMLGEILYHVPFPILWKDLNGVFLGCNKSFLPIAGCNDCQEVIGKTDDDLPCKDFANQYREDDKYVITTGQQIKRIENVQLSDRMILSETTKAPLVQNGKIIGVLVIILDITDKAKRERLEFENGVQKAKITQQIKFHSIMGQMMHDVKSPLYVIDGIINDKNSCLSEDARIRLRNSYLGIVRSVDYVVSKFKDINAVDERPQPLAVAVLLQQIVGEKIYEYRKLGNVEFEYYDETRRFEPVGGNGSDYAFIIAQPTPFKRMMSNIINNAVEALENRENGKVTVSCYVDAEWVEISIKDNGKGMSKEQIGRIESGIVFTEGKENGCGIGTTQIRETIVNNHGTFFINSNHGGKYSGSTFVIKFPKAAKPNWVADEIKITSGTTIVILDDDPAIHNIWNERFDSIIKQDPTIQIKHFTYGIEVIDTLKNLSISEKADIYLLSDFELIGQNHLTGIDVIKACECYRSILVTSHYGETEITELAINNRVRLLPKELARTIHVILDKKLIRGSRIVDMVWLDDEVHFTNQARDNYKHLKIDTYNDPVAFMTEVMQYPLDTRIVLDNQYYSYDLKCEWDGLKIAKELHEHNFTNIILVSGEHPRHKPDYLKVVIKSDLETVNNIDKL